MFRFVLLHIALRMPRLISRKFARKSLDRFFQLGIHSVGDWNLHLVTSGVFWYDGTYYVECEGYENAQDRCGNFRTSLGTGNPAELYLYLCSTNKTRMSKKAKWWQTHGQSGERFDGPLHCEGTNDCCSGKCFPQTPQESWTELWRFAGYHSVDPSRQGEDFR